MLLLLMLTVCKAYSQVMEENNLEGLKIRQAYQADKNAIKEVTLAAYQEYAVNLTLQQWQAYRSNILDTLAEAQPELQLVADLNGEIVGSLLIVPAGPIMEVPENTANFHGFWEVRLLAVTPAVRGQGIGNALMRACVEQARSAGESAITLHTSDFMQTAKNIYERMGFKRDPEMDFYPSEDLVIKGYCLDLG